MILDEPTAVLTPQESEQLFDILTALAKGGVTVILITHKLKEIMAITERVTVMRGGEVILNKATSSTDIQALAQAMIGRQPKVEKHRKSATTQHIKLSIDHLSYTDWQGVQRLKDINLQINSGEIVGIAGVSGNGQSELLGDTLWYDRVSFWCFYYLSSIW